MSIKKGFWLDKKAADLVKACLKKARQKLSSSAKLAKTKSYDDAVSRAYYAAFYAAQAVLLSKGLSTKTHQGLIQLFSAHFIKTGILDKKLGSILAELKDDREKGDYEIYSTLDKKDAFEALDHATEFVSLVETYLNSNQ